MPARLGDLGRQEKSGTGAAGKSAEGTIVRIWVQNRRISVQLSLLSILLALSALAQAQSAARKMDQAEAIPSVAQPLTGRLFFSPEQRARLDRARLPGAVVEESGVVELPVSTVTGFVKRSDGETVVWVDGAPIFNVGAMQSARLQPEDVGSASDKIKIFSQERKSTTVNGSRPAKAQAAKPVRKPLARPSANRGAKAAIKLPVQIP
jgi:hypothetical protein